MSGLRYSVGQHAFPHCAPKSQEDVVYTTKLFQVMLNRKHHENLLERDRRRLAVSAFRAWRAEFFPMDSLRANG